MTVHYRPAHDDEQLLANDIYGSRSCLAYAAATAIDYHSLGELRPTGRQVREASDDPTASIGGIGLNLGNIDVAWRKLVGEALGFTYSGTWAVLRTRRAEGRYLLLLGRYSAFPLAERCQKDFVGPHGIAISPDSLADGRWIMDDPLCDTAKARSEATLRAYATALHSDGLLQYGWTDAPPPLPEPIIAEDAMIAISIGRATVPAGTAFTSTPGGPQAGTLLGSRFTILGSPAGFPDWRALVRTNRQVVYVPASVLTPVTGWPHGEAIQTALLEGAVPQGDCAAEQAAVAVLQANAATAVGDLVAIISNAQAAKTALGG